jgi:transcriptional regulator with XRE-family HTH domain
MEDGNWKAFEREWTDAIVDSINMIRDASELTVRDLAQRLRSLGWPISDATLAGMLSGRKRGSITVAEVFAFARALNVPPLYLILGLPLRGALPDGPLWTGKTPAAPDIADWVTGRSLFDPYPGDALDPDVDPPAYFAEAIARQGLGDVLSQGEFLRMIRWQAAQLVALAEIDSPELAKALPESLINQEWLWSAINGLSAARAGQRRLSSDPGRWSIPLGDVPRDLEFIDADPPVQADDPDVDILRRLTTPELVERASRNFKQLLENLSQTNPGKRDGQTTNSA